MLSFSSYGWLTVIAFLDSSEDRNAHSWLPRHLCAYQCHAPPPPTRGEVGQCGDLHSWFLQCPRGGGATGMQIPYISPLKTLCYMYLGILVLVLNVSNAPPLGQQTADKSPRNPPPYPCWGWWGVTMIGAL